MDMDTADADESSKTERGRLEALSSLWISGTAPEPRFDTIAQLAAQLFDAPMAFVTLVDKDMQRFKALHGVSLPDIPRSLSVCNHTIASGHALVVDDMLKDPRFAGNPLVTGSPFIRFYAGTPLTTAEGFHIGALCIADTMPRSDFGERQRTTLSLLGALVMEQIRLRREEIVRSTVMNFSDATELAFFALDAAGRIEFVNRAALKLFGYDQDEMIGQLIDIIIPDRFRGAHHAGLARVLAGARRS